MTARRRAAEVGSAMRRGMAVPARPSAESAGSQVVGIPHEQTPAKGSKYTALLDSDTAAAFDELALAARRQLGRRVEKSAIMRALIMLAADDASLRDQVIQEIAQRPPS